MTLKALFLDLDETLCDTTLANNIALEEMAQTCRSLYPKLNQEIAQQFAQDYKQGIYRTINSDLLEQLLYGNNEAEFRIALIEHLLSQLSLDFSQQQAQVLQNSFDNTRTSRFDFFDGIKSNLIEWRKQFTLIVITNGPEFSQITKVEQVELAKYVDHIIIGGQEKEQKPAKSIFEKALALANCNPSQAIHIGDSLTCDIQGAINAGIRSVWVKHDQTLSANDPQADDIVDHPSELFDLIKKINA